MTPEGRTVLVCAPFGRDATSVADLLRRDHHVVVVCPDLGAVAKHLDEQVGVVLLTDEALAGDIVALREALAAQPAWADVPFVLLEAARARARQRHGAVRLPLAEVTSNIVVLERPLSIASLTTTVAAATRSRQKQFEIRDRIAELAESGSRLRLATSAADIGTWDFNPVTMALSWDSRCKAMFGVGPDTEVTYEGTFIAGLHPEDRDVAAAAVAAALDPGGDGSYDIEYRTIGIEDGVERCISARGGAVFEDGRAIRFIGTTIDISERRRAEIALARSEAALREKSRALELLNQTLEERVSQRTAALENEMAIRGRTEEALRQSQKMEAVGQLTGGIAHDFNNMLTGVIGGLDIIKRRLASGRVDDLDRFMKAASTSAQRAAALTARLLAFSRRQSLDARPVDVNRLVASLEDLLRRSVHENILLRIVRGIDLPNAIVDANQLENAILNLVFNARDAMPTGGDLTVDISVASIDAASIGATPDLPSGRYVVVTVSDSGVGMSPEILAKVFEPFFTTKPIGQGTGLGLSMVYGFAKQSGGQVRVHSRPGQGTSVAMYLPATDRTEVDREALASPARPGKGQTVLLVEDDESVRLLVRDVLTELAYQAIEAPDAAAAIPLLQSGQPIDMLISDVGLPGIDGRQLAEIAREHRPSLPILFITGYAENAAIRAGFLGTNMSMIGKPFKIEALASKIDEMISRTTS